MRQEGAAPDGRELLARSRREPVGEAAHRATPGIEQSRLPGKGLAEHDFFYAGEAKTRDMFIVRKGQVVWSYHDTTGKGEISDAVLLSNGNILFAHQFGVTLISPEKKVLWHYDAPPKTETQNFFRQSKSALAPSGNSRSQP